MLIGYVSDEMHVAIADAQLEFRRRDESIEVRSRASGAVVGDIPPGRWNVTIAKPGFTRKFVDLDVSPGMEPYRFRLLSDRLLGYMWPKWVRGGESAELRLHSPESFRLSLWRYGWGKEKVADLGLFESFGPGGDRQILPDGDFAARGCDWNHHGYPFGPDARNVIVAPDRSGLYYLHMKAASGAFFSFPWIVAPSQPTSDVAVLASNIDWNAYNDFGGRSNYVAAQFLPIEPAVNVRQHSPYLRDTGGRFWDREHYDPLSFDRPEPVNRVDEDEEIDSPMRRIGSEHVAPATWRLLGWMEREGIAHDLHAETQLQSGVLDLDRYRLVILDQHPEYWSRQMYERLKTWVFERGGTLMYLGGNGLDCEVEFIHDDTATIHRNGDRRHWVEIRDFTGGAGSFPPGRMELTNECPAHLTGLHTTLTGMGTAAPFRVRAADHWAFEGTGLRAGDLFGQKTLDVRNPGGASGHETDKMCEHTPAGTILLAKGTNEHEGGSDLIAFETPKGGQVFSTGSICWICALPVDEQVGRVTANVIRRFSADGGTAPGRPRAEAVADRSHEEAGADRKQEATV